MSEEPSFSQRTGIKPIKKDMQISNMDDDLRVGLWNGLVQYYWDPYEQPNDQFNGLPLVNNFVTNLWLNYFKHRLDKMPIYWSSIRGYVENYYFKAKWNEVYDLLEFVIKNFNIGDAFKTNFTNYSNKILEKEFSVYRFVGDKIMPITSKEEIAEINQALNTPLQPIATHLESAISLLSDKEKPDYRNSIKESISAVEFVCKKIVGKEDTTLGLALNEIQKTGKITIHENMIEAFKKLYNYTSDADGIRHAMMDASNADFDDAKFMLVACSAFINYLISKAGKSGIQLK